MIGEVVQALRASEGGTFVDCTLGMGGHARGILEASPSSLVVGVDRDAEALALAKQHLAPFGDRLRPFHANFKEVATWSTSLPSRPRGILADLGMSTYQLQAGRGFSFRDDGPLDMRMDQSQGAPALDFLASASEDEMVQVFREFGEEPFARPIARAILQRRGEEAPLLSGRELAAMIERVVPYHLRRGQVHPATRVFQALRIFVNGELDGLEQFVRDAVEILDPGGRLAVLAYHSLEDRIVKQTMRDLASGCECPPKLPVCGCNRRPVVRLLGRRAGRPSEDEVARNPAARSARLRVVEKL